MDIKKNKSSVRLPLGLKIVLVAILMILFVKELHAKEIYNAKVIEYFERTVGRISEAFAGVDSTGNGLADTFIIISPLEDMLVRRLANRIKAMGSVSYEDKNKVNDPPLGGYSVSHRDLLEVGGMSVLEIYPGQEVEFPFEATRQKRLSAQAPALPPANQSSAEERRIAELEAELQRLKQGR
jgi:hypothetical protein